MNRVNQQQLGSDSWLNCMCVWCVLVCVRVYVKCIMKNYIKKQDKRKKILKQSKNKKDY